MVSIAHRRLRVVLVPAGLGLATICAVLLMIGAAGVSSAPAPGVSSIQTYLRERWRELDDY